MPYGMHDLPSERNDEDGATVPKSRGRKIDAIVGKRLNAARTKARIGISILARDTDIAVARVIAIEKGAARPRPPELFRLTQILGMHISEVFVGLA